MPFFCQRLAGRDILFYYLPASSEPSAPRSYFGWLPDVE
jgi:hypothetical protein